MINFHAESRPKPSDAISHAISHADVFFDACECLSYDNDNAHVDADVFFDTLEFFDDNAEIETRANDIVSDKTCSSIRTQLAQVQRRDCLSDRLPTQMFIRYQ
jgi:hypothetical protein